MKGGVHGKNRRLPRAATMNLRHRARDQVEVRLRNALADVIAEDRHKPVQNLAKSSKKGWKRLKDGAGDGRSDP